MQFEIRCRKHGGIIGGGSIPDVKDSNYPFYSAGETVQAFCQKCPVELRTKTVLLGDIKRNNCFKYEV